MTGKSKNIYLNQEIWSQPWFIELTPDQKLVYFYIHTNCNQIGVYLHSKKLVELHLDQKIEGDSLIEWFNKSHERIIKLENDAYLLIKFLEEENKRGSKIKPTSNPDLGKVREAISNNILDKLIEIGSFHEECKIFEFGIKESIIRNKAYPSNHKEGQLISPYDKMIDTVRNDPRYIKAFGKPSESLNNSSHKIENVIADREEADNSHEHSSDYYLTKRISDKLYKSDHETVKKINSLVKDLRQKGIKDDPFQLIDYALSEMIECLPNDELTFDNLKERVLGIWEETEPE